MKAVHQLVAGFNVADAISNEALVLRRWFEKRGYASRIFSAVGHISELLRGEAQTLEEAAAVIRPDDVALLHLSIGSAVNDFFAALQCRKAIMYHNMTPADYFRGVQDQLARDLAWGREQARALIGTASVVMADSRYNAAELRALGCPAVRVIPFLMDFDQLRSAPDRNLKRGLRDGKINVLFVGRCAPNKRLEDVLCAFHYFQRYVEPHSRLVHVGSWVGMENYRLFLMSLARDLGLENVVFAGAVPQAELNAYYATADLFLCLSEHEGFCVPLLESMAHGVPVLAFAAAAVPETLAGAGILFREKRWDLIAEMMGQVVRNQPLRAAVLRKQKLRLAQYANQDWGVALEQCLAPLLV